MKSRIVVLFLGIFLQKTGGFAVYPNGQLSVQIGQGFSTYLMADPNFGKLLKCQLKNSDLNESYEIFPAAPASRVTDNYEIITPFVGECGAQVRNVSAKTSCNWQLIAVDDNLVRVDGQFSVQTIGNMGKETVIKMEGAPGQQASIVCPQNGFHYVCVIVDQKGKRFHKCNLDVFYPEIGKEVIYMCHTIALGSTMPTDTIIEVKGKQENSNQEIIRNDKSVVLSCKSSFFNWCAAVHDKTNEVVSIQSNIIGDRYSSAKTDLNTGLCQLEIPTPILANETGIWKIYGQTNQYSSVDSRTGCIFHLDSFPEVEINSLRSRVLVPQTVHSIQQQFSIQCEEAPYKLSYCYLRFPDNQIQYAEPSMFVLTSGLGICRFDFVPIQDGRFTCGFNAPDENGPDIVQDINVHYHPVLDIEATPKEVFVSKNETFSLLCRVVTDDPIQSCMFISPTGVIYNLPKTIFKSSSYSYFGRGLHNGDCGIEFTAPDAEENLPEFGNWTCDVFLKINNANLKAKILVILE